MNLKNSWKKQSKNMNVIDIEKIKKLKSHKDFYQSMINEFYNDALEIYGGDEDVFIDYFMNDLSDLEEILDFKKIDKDELVRLTPVKEHKNGDVSYLFEYAEEFKNRLIKHGIENPTEEDVGKYVLKSLENWLD